VVKATAIDPSSGREASIVGPATAGRDALAQAAARKLKYVMERKS
jgi:ribose 1,5-bisphosphokinase PhnN